MTDFKAGRLFKRCAYCGLIRLCEWRGRGRWICDGCWADATVTGKEGTPMRR